MRSLLLAALAASPALADPPLTAPEFEAWTLGKTLAYSQYDDVYGLEHYLPDRRVEWARSDGFCQTGFWYPEGDQICFLYDGDPETNCFTFRVEGDALVGRFALDAADMPPHYARPTTDPLVCNPDVGA